MNGLVFEVGGTKTRIGITDGRRLWKFLIMPTAPTWLAAKKQFVMAAAKLSAGKKITRVIGGLPGVFDNDHTRLRKAPNLKRWAGQPIKQDLQMIFKAPVKLENDAALAALGEAKYGAGRGYNIVGYVAVGTGVGGALITADQSRVKIHRAEPGHEIKEKGRSLEELISGRSLMRRYRKGWKEFVAADWRWIADRLAYGLAKLTHQWSPEVFVLGGAVVLKGKIPMAYLRKQVAKQLKAMPKAPPMVKAKLGDRAGLVGAIQLS